MFIESLSISDFRNFTSLTAGFSPGVNIFLGNNGSGKTNLLEAIFSLCLGRSQRGVSDNVLLRKGADVYRLTGEIKTGSRQLAVAVAYQKGGRKKITVDKVAARASQLYEHFSVVASGPEDSEILSGPPSARRLFLDIYLSQFLQTYLAELADYHRALRQKNAALKNEMDASPFDRLLVSCGAKIMLARRRFVNSLGPLAVQYHADIASGERLDMEYKPSVPRCGETDELGIIEAAFEAAIKDQARREQAIQTALVGPHRDELEFLVDGLPARTYGSQGQWRTAAISLKLAIYDLLRDKRGASPVILLDEIFAELDHLRAERLMALFGRADQLFLTTAAEAPLTVPVDIRKFKIVNGNVEDSC